MRVRVAKGRIKNKGDIMLNPLTHSLEDYLEIIYIIEKREGAVRITDIATAMSFSKASVSQAINLLKSKELVNQEKYGKITLTPKGMREARNVYKRHKILNEFFIKVLKVDPQTASVDACKAEHILSLETLRNIEHFLSEYKNGGKIIEHK